MKKICELKSVISAPIIMAILKKKANIDSCLLDAVHKGFPRGVK
ncbi:hypothetical protein PROVRETT_07069 [Providencia rettgeri DSM 1131]|nr:hypothetical protein PROVRETT_07069 [Providencia rettgeri DSM 1131]